MDDVRHFACTSCGRCCDRGPEMELSEATSLASTFITRVMFKVHSLPLYPASRRGQLWRDQQHSRLSVGDALAEARDHLANFSVLDEVDKARGRSLHLTISAITVDKAQGRCPALIENGCSIYETRPHTCRAVPLHYSRPASSLTAYLDAFAARPDYGCDTSPGAPLVLQGASGVAPQVAAVRLEAVAAAGLDGAWRREIAAILTKPARAESFGLPSYELVKANSDRRVASLVSMIGAWRVARVTGLLEAESFAAVCRHQARLLSAAAPQASTDKVSGELNEMLLGYELELSAVQLGALSVPGKGLPPASPRAHR